MARREFIGAMLASRKATFGVVVVALIVLGALLSPQLAPYDPGAQSLAGRLLPPLSTGTDGLLHLLGTDQLGRDILSRLIYGARISLMVGICASLLAGTLGVLLGLLAGYFGDRVDDAIMRLCDVQLALPYILVAMAILAIAGSSLLNIILVLSMTQWVTYARVVRSGVLTVKEQDYVLAGRTLGLSNFAHHRALHIAERARAGDRDRNVLGGADHRGGSGLELSRARGAAVDPVVGRHAGGRAHLSGRGLVARHHSRPRHLAHGDRGQPVRRLAARLSRSEIAGVTCDHPRAITCRAMSPRRANQTLGCCLAYCSTRRIERVNPGRAPMWQWITASIHLGEPAAPSS
jgi:ABC-type nitrate/sulfonate/bicarbonate transport system permease component